MASFAGHAILEAASAPGGWTSALELLRRNFNANHTIMFTNGASRTNMPFLATAGLDDGALARFSSPYAIALWSPWQAMTPGAAMASHDILTDQQFSRLEFYNEIIRPTGCFYGAVIQMESGDLSFHTSVCRERSVGPYSGRELSALQETIHGLKPVLSWHRRLHELSLHVEALEQAIDGLTDAVFLFDARRRPVYLNSAAQILTAVGGPLRLEADGLTLTTPGATHALVRAMSRALDAASLPASSTLRFAQGDAPDLIVTVSRGPLPGYTPRGVSSARVAVVVRLSDAVPPILERDIAERFGLTGREARVAIEIAGGRSLDGVAHTLGIGIGTVRGHLKGIFGKTGVSSQASLVSLLLDGRARTGRSQ